jgi:hypothetical protein
MISLADVMKEELVKKQSAPVPIPTLVTNSK